MSQEITEPTLSSPIFLWQLMTRHHLKNTNILSSFSRSLMKGLTCTWPSRDARGISLHLFGHSDKSLCRWAWVQFSSCCTIGLSSPPSHSSTSPILQKKLKTLTWERAHAEGECFLVIYNPSLPLVNWPVLVHLLIYNLIWAPPQQSFIKTLKDNNSKTLRT